MPLETLGFCVEFFWPCNILWFSFSREETLWPRSCWGDWPGQAACTSSLQTFTPHASSASQWPPSSLPQRTSWRTGASSPRWPLPFWLRRRVWIMRTNHRQGKTRWLQQKPTRTQTRTPGLRRRRTLRPGWTKLKWSCGLTRLGTDLGEQCVLSAAAASLCRTPAQCPATTSTPGPVLKRLPAPPPRHPQQDPLLCTRSQRCLHLLWVNRSWKSWQSSTACPVSATSGCSAAGTSCAAPWRFHRSLKNTCPRAAGEWTVWRLLP